MNMYVVQICFFTTTITQLLYETFDWISCLFYDNFRISTYRNLTKKKVLETLWQLLKLFWKFTKSLEIVKLYSLAYILVCLKLVRDWCSTVSTLHSFLCYSAVS